MFISSDFVNDFVNDLNVFVNDFVINFLPLSWGNFLPPTTHTNTQLCSSLLHPFIESFCGGEIGRRKHVTADRNKTTNGCKRILQQTADLVSLRSRDIRPSKVYTNDFPVKHKPSTNTNVFINTFVTKPLVLLYDEKLVSLPDPTSYNVRVVFVNDFVNKPPKPPLRFKTNSIKLMENEDVVFKTILTDNAMKLMENEDVEPFSHFDVVFKTILTDNAEDVVFKTILKDVLVDDFVNTKVNTSKRPISKIRRPGGGGAP